MTSMASIFPHVSPGLLLNTVCDYMSLSYIWQYHTSSLLFKTVIQPSWPTTCPVRYDDLAKASGEYLYHTVTAHNNSSNEKRSEILLNISANTFVAIIIQYYDTES